MQTREHKPLKLLRSRVGVSRVVFSDAPVGRYCGPPSIPCRATRLDGVLQRCWCYMCRAWDMNHESRTRSCIVSWSEKRMGARAWAISRIFVARSAIGMGLVPYTVSSRGFRHRCPVRAVGNGWRTTCVGCALTDDPWNGYNMSPKLFKT